ncbi:MAG: FKBP-type peptidyl-prolyl cis-trans isomerase [Planctomycetia bacterium]|nr:FKBP-type peptidyl-prolyl cis-trans isomerase [Planctomycetia bacterium]
MSATRRSRKTSSGRDRLRVEVLEPRQVLASTLVVVGSDIGAASTPLIRLMNAETGAIVAQTLAFEQAFRGGVRVAMADVDGNGTAEILAAPGPGRVGEIRVFEQQVTGGATSLRELANFRTQPFGPGSRGGIDVAGGDVDGDGRDDIVAAVSRGPGLVNVYRAPAFGEPISNTPFRTFSPFSPTFIGGASVAVADLGTFTNGSLVDAARPDGKVEIVVGSGAGMAAQVAVYDVSTSAPRVVDTIAAFTTGFRGGVTVTAGRYDADQIDDLVVSSAAGGPGTEVYDGRVGAAANPRLASFAAFAGLSRERAAAFVAGIDRNGDGRIDGFVGTQATAGNGVALVSQAGSRTQVFSNAMGPLRVAALRTSFNDFVSTLSGMRYRVLTPAAGTAPTSGQTVRTQYTGWLVDGTKFDSSRDRGQPFEFRLGAGQVIAGWDEIIAQMKPGERRTVIIPPSLAYGGTARPNIPANSTLVFDMELLSAT